MKRIRCIFFLALLLPCAVAAQGLLIGAGAYVVASSGSLETTGNFTNNGSFTHSGGLVLFNGATQNINGTSATVFNNITIAAGSTTTFATAGEQIKNVLLSNGTCKANGNLTLLSTASQTASISGSGTGEVQGNVIVQRYIASGFGYKYFSSPFIADTVGDFSPFVNLTAGFPAFYSHDESLTTNGWVNYTTGSNVLQPMRGYAANLGNATAAKTVSLKGTVNNHALSLTLYNHNTAYTQGFNLVGNPYPSPINWDAAGGWVKSNVDNAVYFFNAGTVDQYTGVYSSYINGVSSDGLAGPVIGAMQGFFVHVSNGSFPVTATLGVNNTARAQNNTAHFFRFNGALDQQPLLRLTASLEVPGGNTDAFTVYFDDAATGKFNTSLDALKLLNTDSLTPSLFALTPGADKLSIRALTGLKDSAATVPLGLMTKRDAWVNFRLATWKDMPAGVYPYLLDKKAARYVNLQQDSGYRVLLSAGDYEGRFFIVFSKTQPDGGTIAPVNSGSLRAYYAAGNIMVNPGIANGGQGELRVLNSTGQLLLRQNISGNSYVPVPAPASAGIYIVQLLNNGTLQSKKIMAGGR